MGWLEDLGNAVSSGVAVVADAVETVVETVTDTAENVVDAGCDAIEDSVDYVVDWLNINGGAIVGGFANVIGGIVNGAIDAIQQIVGGVLHIVKDVGAIVGSLLRLDLPGLINAVLHLLLDVGILILDVLRTVLLGFFIGHIVDNFDRNSLRRFVNRRLGNAFAEPRRTQVRTALRMNDPLWGLRPHVTHKTFVMESPAMPLADMHRDGTLDLFAMAGVLSFNSFGIFQPRFTVKWLDKNGRESTFPASRYHIAKFLEDGQPNLRIYAQTASELRDRIQFATKHFNGMGIRPTWNHFITVPQRTPLTTHSITQVGEFNLVCFQQAVDAVGFVTVESDELGRFLNDTGLKDPTERETNITSITPFHVLVQVANVDGDLLSSDDFFGDTAGRDIEEGERAEGCQTQNRTDQCCILVKRADDQRRQLGSGVAMRNVYPGFFSKMVMAHEMGHYFGLCHINHNGVQNIMFSNAAGNSIWDWGLFSYYLNAEPTFTPRDKRNVWRFIVDQLRNEL
jgi:hypothetical protein